MNVYIPYTRLPSAYQEVEYIQSSGTQYINLGWHPTDNYFKVVCKATVYNSGNEWNVLFGTTNGSNSLSLQFRLANPYWNEGWYANIGSSGNIYSSISFVDGENVNINFTGNDGSYSLSLNNDTSIGSYNSTVAQSTRPFYLFAFNENGDTTRKTNVKLYSFKLYSGVSTLVRDLVPCYRKSDGVIGLYDLVNSVFYTNQGTGIFSKGNDVTMAELKNAYIGEVYEYNYDFRNKTTTQLANDGWTNTSSLTTGANGVTASNWNRIFNQLSGLGTAMSNAKKITMTMLMYDAGSVTLGSIAGVTLTTGTDGYTQTGFYTNDAYACALCGSASEIILKSQSVYNTQGDYTLSAVFDFVNKTVSVVFPSVYTGSASLTDAGITTAKTNNTVGCPLQYDRYVKTISILIEK